MTRLGYILQCGNLILPNYEEAARWFSKSARLGDTAAMYLLADLYRNGDGVDQSDEKCRYWMSQAAMRGFVPAQRWIDENLSKLPKWLERLSAREGEGRESYPENSND